MSDWNARRILKELVTPERRREILIAFWRHADAQSRIVAQAQLAKALHFRDETIRKMPPEKKADLLASRIGVAEYEQFVEMALMLYHTHQANELLAAFLDRWGVPHVNGSIEAEDYTAPDESQVRSAVTELEPQFSRGDVVLYLATAGLLMGDEWRKATWPVVAELTTSDRS